MAHNDLFLSQEGDGIPDLATTREVVAALRRVGFEVIEFSDFADHAQVLIFPSKSILSMHDMFFHFSSAHRCFSPIL